ncbi:mannitol dehydrogenase family protein [Actinomadura yumaensis]|nr:mannitol dehydrogenase [Brevundimonas sp. DS20]MBJ7510339.1 mannitol dehydrogenase family protein [Brevundimonas sp.]MEC7798388.1 mannitol dehydrogenase family protein [Pseudomonadota bacterium]MED5536856.1 mannitol dehydrogenase family protein [Pseudomonadota bacterium]QFU32120.1 Mannitol 2-dehydrogenase [Brevundimonas sp. Bb-A]
MSGPTSRLNSEALSRLPLDVAQPRYDRAEVKTGVVHLGVGAFHRAHQAVVFDDALAGGDLRWGVLGASLRSPGVRDQLNPQEGLYTLVVRDGAREDLRVIGAGCGVLVGPEDPAALVAAMARAEVHIVTLTVTEKGYRIDPASGDLIFNDPDVAADLTDLEAPRTAPGFLVAALKARKAAGLKPFTVISCDNLPQNGQRIRAAVLAMAGRIDPDLADWIRRHGAFPQTMIDRIVPATTPDDVARLTGRLGVEDQGMVKTEPFTQWVIENHFAGERPDFPGLGVQLAESVEPWENAKLRLLNGAHSALSYLGALAGFEHVHEVVGVPSFRTYVEALWDEVETTLEPPPGLVIADYRNALMARFCNAALMHRTRQIAIDGSQKLPQRLLATAADRLAAGLGIKATALGVAAWMRWQSGLTEGGERFEVDDPLAAETARRLAEADNEADQVLSLLRLAAVFPQRLAADDRFALAVTDAYLSLCRKGAVEAAREAAV